MPAIQGLLSNVTTLLRQKSPFTVCQTEERGVSGLRRLPDCFRESVCARNAQPVGLQCSFSDWVIFMLTVTELGSQGVDCMGMDMWLWLTYMHRPSGPGAPLTVGRRGPVSHCLSGYTLKPPLFSGCSLFLFNLILIRYVLHSVMR